MNPHSFAMKDDDCSHSFGAHTGRTAMPKVSDGAGNADVQNSRMVLDGEKM
jgi:hypothetical protein